MYPKWLVIGWPDILIKNYFSKKFVFSRFFFKKKKIVLGFLQLNETKPTRSGLESKYAHRASLKNIDIINY